MSLTLSDYLILGGLQVNRKRLLLFRQQIKRWFFLFLGLAWSSLNVFIWFNYSNNLVTKPHVSNLTGYVCSVIPETQSTNITNHSHNSEIKKIPNRKSITFDFCVTSMESEITDELIVDHPFEVPQINIFSNNKIKLSIYNFNSDSRLQLVSGTIMTLKAKIKPIHGRVNPNGFAYEKWLVSESYIATGYVKKITTEQIEAKPINTRVNAINSIKQFYNHQRQKLYSHLESISANNQFQGLILALSIGEKRMISDEQWSIFKNSGTSHLLAISGLHIGIASLWSYYSVYFFIMFWNFLTKGRYFLSPKRPAMLGSIIGGLSIALISGLGYPAQRAVLMLLVFYFNKISHRHYSTPSILSITFILIVLIQPFSILSEGFWLSFLAVSIILLSLSYGLKGENGRSKLVSWFRVNLFIFIGLTPISWFFFSQVSIVSLATNLVLIPLTSLFTAPIVYLGMLLSSINIELASLIFNLANKLLTVSYWIQSELANWNNDLDYFNTSLGFPSLLLLIMSSILILLPSKFPSRILVLPITLVTLIGLFSPNLKQHQPFKMVVFDIGQGLAVYIGNEGKHLIYDTGYGNSDFAMANSVILPFLKANGIKKIDRLIISHGDSDHRGGLESILSSISVKQLFSGDKIDVADQLIEGLPIQNCHSADSWRWGNAIFKFINFRKENPSRTSDDLAIYDNRSNNFSCVLSISIKGKKLLLTGDIEKKAETLLIEQNAMINSHLKHDVIVVPHHGSLTSSTEAFVKIVNAKDAIFSTGYANQWQFPKTEVIERYRRYGANIWITDKQGAISLIFDKDDLMVSAERESYQHFWNNH